MLRLNVAKKEKEHAQVMELLSNSGANLGEHPELPYIRL